MNTVVLFIMSVAISHTASERSGMLACNPNDETQKPVIYAFDGKHLIKDNDPTTPYKYLSSISDQFDVYFAFVPTDDYKEKSARFNKAKSFVTNNYKAINKVLNDLAKICNSSVTTKNSCSLGYSFGAYHKFEDTYNANTVNEMRQASHNEKKQVLKKCIG